MDGPFPGAVLEQEMVSITEAKRVTYSTKYLIIMNKCYHGLELLFSLPVA